MQKALLAWTALFAFAAFAQDAATTARPLPWVDRLGLDACSFVYRAGWAELRPRLEHTHAGRALASPGAKALFDDLARVARRSDSLAPVVKLVLSALHHEVVMITFDVPLAADRPDADSADAARSEPPSPRGARRSVRLAIVAPPAHERGAFRRTFESGVAAMPGDLTRVEIDGVQCMQLGAVDPPLLVGSRDDLYFWATDRAALERAARRPDGPTLQASRLFQATVGPLLEGRADPPIALYYFNFEPDWNRIQDQPADAVWSQMSWRSLDAVAGATFIEGRGFRNRHYWKIGDRRLGLFRHTEDARLDETWLRRVPADVSGFTTGVADATSFLLSAMMLGAAAFGDQSEGLEPLALAVVPLQPLLRTLGNRYLVYRRPGRYGGGVADAFLPSSNLVGVWELRDAEAFQSALDGVLALGPAWMRGSVHWSGVDVRSLNLVYLSLHVAVLERAVLLSTSLPLLKDAIDNWRSPGASIVDTPAFKAARQRCLPDACFMMYFPPGGFARGIYDHYVPQAQQVVPMITAFASMFSAGGDPGRTEDGLRLEHLPRGDELVRGVDEGTILTARDDGVGVLFDGYAPLLSTPYYLPYAYALLRLSSTDAAGLATALPPLAYLLSPAQVADDASAATATQESPQ